MSSDDGSFTDDKNLIDSESNAEDNANDIVQYDLQYYLTGVYKAGDTVQNQDVIENETEVGNGDESDDDVPDMNELQAAMDEVTISRMDDTIDVGALDYIGCESETPAGECVRFFHRQPQDNWVNPEPKPGTDEPCFDDVDNPGKWSSFSFRLKYKKVRTNEYNYEGHDLPTGCVPVEKNGDSKRIIDDWEFFIKDGREKIM